MRSRSLALGYPTAGLPVVGTAVGSLLYLLLCLLPSDTATAQTVDDALRFSEVFPLGTARSLGTANSMSAIGADWSAAAANPAGLATFRRNEFAITTAGIITGSTNPTYDGAPSSGAESDTRVAVPQISLVLTRQPIGSKWKQFNFGVGVSQSNRFEEQIGFEGRNSGSITDVWLDEANRYAVDENGARFFDDPDGDGFGFATDPVAIANLGVFGAGLAFDADVLIASDDREIPEFYTTDYDDGREDDVFGDRSGPGAPLDKRGIVTRRGRNAAIDLSFGANYDERLMLGVTLGLSRLRYESTFNYRERDDEDAVPFFDDLAYNEFAEITGTGLQVRLGAIYRASQALRLGLAYHSPNFISVEDAFTNNLRYRYTTDDGPQDKGTFSPAGGESVLAYDFRSPSQYKASAGVLVGRRGFVSTEVTYLNFGGGRFGAPDDATEADEAFVDAINDDIAADLRSAVQVRVGGEVNLAPLQLRAGFQYLGGPIEGEDAVLGVNAGVGFRQNRLGLDLGYQGLIRPDRTFQPYGVFPTNFPSPRVDYTPISHTVALTLGWKLVSL